MTADVISFTPKWKAPDPPANDADGPHIEGPAFCSQCNATWTAVAPVGVIHMECPKCRRFWGLFKNAIEPELAWHCDCGEALFFITKAGVMCRKCGVIQEDWWL